MNIPPKLISITTSILTPLVLLGFALRLLLSPLFLQVEYHMPGFPVDEYGLTIEDRLRWAPYAVDYLINDAGIEYLAALQFDDGTLLYNERELSHMQDVKGVTKGALNVFYVALTSLTLIALWSRRQIQWRAFLEGLRRGGWWMIYFAAALALVVLVGMFLVPDLFNVFFTGFHSLFFEGESWIFLYSDTLIRLFPIRFWQDAFLFAALIAIAGGLWLAKGIKTSQQM